jgi:hypothetical protein
MARFLAVDWDTQEVRFLLAAASGGSVKIEAAGATPLVMAGGKGKPAKPDVGQSLPWRASRWAARRSWPGWIAPVSRCSI